MATMGRSTSRSADSLRTGTSWPRPRPSTPINRAIFISRFYLRDETLERPLFGAARVFVDLPDGAEVIRQVGDTGYHPAPPHVAGRTRCPQHLEPAVRFIAQAAADLGPRGFIDAGRLPGLVPFRVGKRVAAFAAPAV